MADLRSLIKYADDSTLRSVVGLTTNYGSQYRQIRMYDFCQAGTQPYTNAFFWRAPQGTNFVKIEIWGSGGSGAGVCCCMWGFPGGAGAYAYRNLCAKDLGDLSGCPFEFCVGSGSCCTNNGTAPNINCYASGSWVTNSVTTNLTFTMFLNIFSGSLYSNNGACYVVVTRIG